MITRTGAKTSQTLLVTNKAALLGTIARQYESIRDFSATVDMTPALGSAEKSRITEYKDIRGYILYRAPSDIRIVGLYPVVRNKAFDMVSNGLSFKLYIPAQNRFVVGANTIEEPSKNKIENLRPQHLLEGLLVRSVDPLTEKVMLENFTDEEDAFYVLHMVRENGGGELQLLRTVWVSRIDLRISRQMILDPDGNILTDTRYTDWQVYDNVLFPKHVEINRPRDEYGVVIDIVKMDINAGVSDDKLVLEQPEGSRLHTLGQAPPAPAAPAQPAPPAKGRSRKK